MNREIKFRVYDLTERIYQHDKGILSVSFNQNGDFFPYGTGKSDKEWPNRFVIQQFTGLKDKNSREIYEGDIVKSHEFEDWGDTIGFIRIAVVDFRNGKYGTVVSSCFKENGAMLSPCWEELEVIGNIFENEKLLTKSELLENAS